MAERIYTGPVKKQLRGNREDALTLEREARTKVGYLFDAMRPGETFKTGSWTLGDGRRIMAFVWNDVLGKRATVRLTGVGGEETIELFFCEAGLLRWNALTPYHPLKVYVGDRMRTLPLPELTDGEYYPSTYWPTQSPENEYPDLLNDFYVDRNYWPSFWSGKARLMLQGLHAIKRDPKEVFGVDINSNYQGIWKVGLVNYCVVRIGAGGVFVTKLRFPDEASDKAKVARQKLLSENLANDDQVAMAEACMMSALVLNGDPIEVLSAAEIAPCLAEGGAMAYGWKFARNKMEASIVTFKETCMPEFEDITCIGQFETSLFTITAEYDYDLDSWSASITHPYGPIRCRPRSAINSIYKPQYGAFYSANYVGVVPGWGENPFPACCYIQFEGSVQPHYCWYDTADKLQIVWYVQYADAFDSESTLRDPPAYCSRTFFNCSGRYGEGAGLDNGYREGGWIVRALDDGIPVSSELRDPFYSYTNQVYEITAAENGQTSVEVGIPSVSDTPYLNSIQTFCDSQELYDTYFGYGPSLFTVTMTTYEATVREYYELQGFTANPRLWSFVIAADDAEAVYILEREKSETIGAKMVGDGTYTEWGGGQKFFSGHVKYEYELDRYTDPHVDTLDWYGDFQLGMQYGIWNGVFPSMSPPMVEVEPEQTTVTPAKYTHYSPHGATDLGLDGQWGDFFPPSILEALFISGQPIKTTLSFLGDGKYSTGAAATENLGGYAAEPGLEGFFIGGA